MPNTWRSRAGRGRTAAPLRVGRQTLPPQRLEHLLERPAVDRQAGLALKIGDRFLGLVPDRAVGLADVVAAPGEQRLQFAPLGPRQAGIVGRPGRDDAGAA